MISNRLLSLDAFRGFTIAAMLLVNNPGDWGHLYSQLAHAKWNGWTFTDWISNDREGCIVSFMIDAPCLTLSRNSLKSSSFMIFFLNNHLKLFELILGKIVLNILRIHEQE